MKNWILLLSILLMVSCQPKTKEASANLSNQRVDEVKIPSLTFNELEPKLKTKSDTLYVVNFWATWCEPCIEELPAFEEVNQEYRDQPFKMYLVSLDFNKQKEKKLIPFVEKNRLQAEVIHLNDPDANAWIEKVDSNWSGSIPATLIFTKEKRVFFEKTFTKEQLRNTINNFK